MMNFLATMRNHITQPVGQVFITSAVIMLLELICIRWIAAVVRLFGFFINFSLMACLLGIGMGVLAYNRRLVGNLSYPVILLGLVSIVIYFQYSFNVPNSDMLFYGNEAGKNQENWIALPFIFCFITFMFVPLGQKIGYLFRSLKPLVAYSADIVGSLFGILIFTCMSWFSLPPEFWFAALGILSFPILKQSQRMTSVIIFSAIIFTSINYSSGDIWSSYYRIRYHQIEGGYEFSVNNIGHQAALSPEKKETFYHRPYDVFGNGAFKKVLIIGSGTGSDVALALSRGAERVVAVEIDRELYKLGTKLHPNRPYDDPRVTVHIDDGRAYMRHTNETFDLIIFALTDSLTLTSGYANVRLESFLYTQESINQARDRLTENGLLVLYNYYREAWSIQRLASLAQNAFGSSPFVTAYGESGRAAALLAGPRLRSLDPSLDKPYVERAGFQPGSGVPIPIIGMGRMEGLKNTTVSTDDWPFFYLLEPALPELYRLPILMVIGFSVLMIALTTPKGTMKSFTPELFFMGVAFMLLEARSLVTFALLFGTTWMVNALVFFAILTSVLISILVSAKIQFRQLNLLYALLFIFLALNYFISPEAFLAIGSESIRYPAIAIFTFAPVFTANMIFSQAFAKVSRPETAFAWNLIGIMLGGLCEYLALLTGYRGLLLLVMASYAAAFFFATRKAKLLAAPQA
jgi:SAM-dependent methyltransferase